MSTTLTRIVRACFIFYLSLALLFTSNRILWPYLPARFLSAVRRITIKQPSSTVSQDVLLWQPSYPLAANSAPATLSADLFLAKAFAQSHAYATPHDTSDLRIVPYYYRASGHIDDDDITVTTLVTRDRFPVLAQLVARYSGPISVTIHVPTDTSPAPLLAALHALYTSSPAMAARVDVHLALARAAHARRFNAWRNAARLLARTQLVMLLDVDFVPCTDFRARVRAAAHTPVGALLRAGTAALVVPAFEYVDPVDGRDPAAFPRDKPALRALVADGRVAMFHAAWAPGHNSTDYARFLHTAAPGEVYRAAAYQHAYEPYVIFRRDGLPWCDERFVGYGGNKAACLFEMHLAGVAFYVLSDDFLMHHSHAYAEEARRLERRYNRKIYADFREETCLKYLMAFHAEGALGSPRAHNAREECKKIRGVARAAAQLVEGK